MFVRLACLPCCLASAGGLWGMGTHLPSTLGSAASWEKKLPLFPKLPTLESHVLAFQEKDCVPLCLIWQCPSCEGSPKLLL